MEKALDIIITIVFIIALAAIGYFVYKGISSEKETENTEIGSIDGEDTNNEDEVGYFEDGVDTADIDYNYEDLSGIPDEYDDTSNKRIQEDKASDTPSTTSSNTKVASPKPKTSIPKPDTRDEEFAEKSAGTQTNKSPGTSKIPMQKEFLVLAGSFGVKNNADAQLKILKDLGYSPEIVQFDNSKMYSVVAARYASRGSADAAAEQLKNKKVECFVMKKR